MKSELVIIFAIVISSLFGYVQYVDAKPAPEPEPLELKHDVDLNIRQPDNRLTVLTITLDKESYKTGEIIKVSGNTGIKNSDSLATVTLLKPDGTVVTTIQIMPNNDGIVSYHFKAGSGNMNVSGEYIIKFQYDGKTIFKEFFFNVIEDRTGIPIPVNMEPPFFGIFVHIDNLFSWIMGK